jgi:hypothetical protein
MGKGKIEDFTYNAVELAAFVAHWAALGVLMLASAELAEVLGRLRDGISEEVHFDSAQWFAWCREDKNISACQIYHAR